MVVPLDVGSPVLALLPMPLRRGTGLQMCNGMLLARFMLPMRMGVRVLIRGVAALMLGGSVLPEDRMARLLLHLLLLLQQGMGWLLRMVVPLDVGSPVLALLPMPLRRGTGLQMCNGMLLARFMLPMRMGVRVLIRGVAALMLGGSVLPEDRMARLLLHLLLLLQQGMGWLLRMVVPLDVGSSVPVLAFTLHGRESLGHGGSPASVPGSKCALRLLVIRQGEGMARLLALLQELRGPVRVGVVPRSPLLLARVLVPMRMVGDGVLLACGLMPMHVVGGGVLLGRGPVPMMSGLMPMHMVGGGVLLGRDLVPIMSSLMLAMLHIVGLGLEQRMTLGALGQALACPSLQLILTTGRACGRRQRHEAQEQSSAQGHRG